MAEQRTLIRRPTFDSWLVLFKSDIVSLGTSKGDKMASKRDLYAAVARRVDTEGTKINAAETSRVIKEFFDVLVLENSHNVLDAVDFCVKEIKRAQGRTDAQEA